MDVDWEAVYRDTFGDLVRYLHRKVWDADRARDLAQEAFARSLDRDDVTIEVLDGDYHEVLQERERYATVAAIRDWLFDHLP